MAGVKIAQTDRRLVARLTGAPDVAVPWLDRFYEPGDVAILRELAEGGLSADELKTYLFGARMVRCDDIVWSLWSISMAGWNALLSGALAVALAVGIAGSRGARR